MKECSSCNHKADFGFVTLCDECFDRDASDGDTVTEQLQRAIALLKTLEIDEGSDIDLFLKEVEQEN